MDINYIKGPDVDRIFDGAILTLYELYKYRAWYHSVVTYQNNMYLLQVTIDVGEYPYDASIKTTIPYYGINGKSYLKAECFKLDLMWDREMEI